MFPKSFRIIILYICGKDLSTKRSGCENGIEFSNSDEIKKAISYHEPEVIINAVALTNVDKCEMKQDKFFC